MRLIRTAVLILGLMITLCSCGRSFSSKDLPHIQKKLFELERFECTAKIKVISNKNQREYIVKQYYSQPDKYRMEILDPPEMKGILTVYTGQDLVIHSPYGDNGYVINQYPMLLGNRTLITDFFKNYTISEQSQAGQDAEGIWLSTKIPSGSRYTSEETLLIDTKTYLPKELTILDAEGGTKIYIYYNEFFINPRMDEKALFNLQGLLQD